MRTRRPLALTLALVALAPVAGCGADSGPDGAAADPVGEASEPTCPAEGERWEVAKLYIEHNATDVDTGVHGAFGGEAWRELCITGPTGEQLLLVDPRNQLDGLAMSDLLFESREPPGDEYSVDDLRSDFPEGSYTVSGTGHDGVARIGQARFTHAIPAAPTIVAPPLADDAETASSAPVDPDGLTIAWEPVTTTVDGDPITVSGYQVIVTDEEFEDPDGWSRPIYDVHVGPEVTSLDVPPGFLRPATIYEIEVLALEPSGNQTITVGFVTTL